MTRIYTDLVQKSASIRVNPCPKSSIRSQLRKSFKYFKSVRIRIVRGRPALKLNQGAIQKIRI
jgi:hypothetical protein